LPESLQSKEGGYDFKVRSLILKNKTYR